MQNKLLLIGLLLVTACDGGTMPIDAKKFLSELEGPKVPTMQETLLENARSAERQGEWMAAGQIYEQILDKDPGNKDIMVAMAECYRRVGDYDRALTMYNAALEKDSNLINAKEGKALALMAKGDFDTPGVLLEDVMKVDAKRWKTLNALGILFATRNLHAEAQQYFKESLKFSPGNTSIMNNLGLSHAMNKEYDVAVDTLMQAGALTVASGGDRKRIDMNLALVYAISGRLDDARMITEAYYSGPELNNNMGFYAHLANDNGLARDYLNMALTQSRTFYSKAWDNLQSLNSASGSDTAQPAAIIKQAPVTAEPVANKQAPKSEPAPVTEAPKPKPKPKAKAKPAPVKEEPVAEKIPGEPEELPVFETEPMEEESKPGDISDIIGSTGE